MRMCRRPTRKLWLRAGMALSCLVAGLALIALAPHGALRVIGGLLTLLGAIGQLANARWLGRGGGYQ